MIRLLIVGDQPAVRKGLHMRLAAEADFAVVGEAKDGETAIQMATAHCPDIVVIDADMLHIDGIALANALHVSCPQTAIIILSLQDDAATCKRVSECGAAALVTKSNPAESLLMTIRQIAHFA